MVFQFNFRFNYQLFNMQTLWLYYMIKRDVEEHVKHALSSCKFPEGLFHQKTFLNQVIFVSEMTMVRAIEL